MWTVTLVLLALGLRELASWYFRSRTTPANLAAQHNQAPNLNAETLGPGSKELYADEEAQTPSKVVERTEGEVKVPPLSAVTYPVSQEPSTAVVTDQGILSHAHSFVMYNPVLNNINANKEKVLRWLAKFTIPGAEFDSSLRIPPPECHPGTRLELLRDIRAWIENTLCAQRLLWLRGSAGVGKSAIIQTVAEGLSASSKLGASLFFSRPNKREKPTLVFPTIAYQLAVRVPFYKEYLARKMADDPKLLEKDMMSQFRVLIAEPFAKGTTGNSDVWAILLDGLDECEGEDAQKLIIRLVSQFTMQNPTSLLVWVIASRPEVHLIQCFGSDAIVDSVLVYDVPVDSGDACRDVENYLRESFTKIRDEFRDLLPTNTLWPGETAESQICRSALGHFGVVSTMIRFIGDLHVCDPVAQLGIVMSSTPAEDSFIDPLSTLHSLYTRILEAVPPNLLPVLKLLITYVLAVADNDDDLLMNLKGKAPLVVAATLLNLQQHTVYAALRKLHSVIKVPSPKDSASQSILFYHASFADYLRDQVNTL
ncbi:hypothetical protein AN958_07413 [Leucoagaricus sp. SymC.cos]|nr:hypothetical protein AN958_07413 [Leucoagaricus sp. SymC.cos]